MTVKYSLDLNITLKPDKKKNCIDCGLYLNQAPVLDNSDKSQIFWVGLSAVRFKEGMHRVPLSKNTRSGALIEKIELPLRKTFSFYKTNVVKCLPLKAGKVRYPSKCEMEKCYSNFDLEIKQHNPSIIFLLGKQVASFVLKKHGFKDEISFKDFEFKQIKINNIIYIPIYHPSYILVYKRKQLGQYINKLRKICEDELPKNQSYSIGK